MLKDNYKNAYKIIANYKYAIGLLLSACSLLIIIFLGVLPQIDKHGRISREEEIIKRKIEVLENFASKHKNYEAYYNKSNNKYSKLKEKLSKEIKEDYYIAVLQEAAKMSGGILNSASFKPDSLVEAKKIFTKKAKSEKSVLAKYGISIKYTGKYDELMSFLEILDSNIVNNLDALHIRNTMDGKLVLDGNFETYVLR